MKKCLLVIFTLVLGYAVQSQTFTGAGGTIPDGGPQTCFPINVSGTGVIDANYGLASVCLSANHSFDADLEIILRSPDGTEVQLSISNGGTGANYTNTCFSATASDPISTGTAPFTGTFLPQGYLGNVNNGQNADGTWWLCVQDMVPNDMGSLLNWELTFNNSPAAPPASCTGNPAAGDSWATATPICNFNGFCGNTSSSYKKDTWPELTSAFCGNIDNNSFASFIAASTTASFNVWVTNSLNALGIQMFFFSNSSGSGPVTSHGCYNQIFPSSGGPTLVTAAGLVPGNKYYLMIDGKDGDVCDYTIAAATGVNILNITPSSGGICPGKTISLTASGGDGSYTWSPAAGLNKTMGANVTSTPDTTTIYTVTSGNNSSCPLTAQATVSIYETPNLGPDITQGLCAGSSVDLTARFNLTNLTTNWTKAGVPEPSPDAVTTTGVYRLIANTNHGCSDDVLVTVNTISKPNLGADASAQLCKDRTADLTQVYNISNLVSEWAFAGQPVLDPKNVSFPGAYRLVVSGGTNCTDTASVNLVLYPTPDFGNDKAIGVCPGLTVDLTSLFNTGGLTVQWTKNGLPVSNPSVVSSSGDYQLVAYQTAGCADTALVNVSVNSVLNIGADTTLNICTGTIADLTSLYSTSSFVTEWTLNGNLIAPPVAEFASGTYRLIASDGSNCSDTVYINLVVNSNPSLGSNVIVPVCPNVPVDLTKQFNTTGLASAWTYNNVPVLNPTTVKADGVYQLIASSIYGCKDTVAAQITTTNKPNLGIDKTLNLCSGVTYNLNTLFPLTGLNFVWIFQNNLPVSNPTSVTKPGLYKLIASSGIGCADTAYVGITTISKLELGPDKTKASCEGSIVDLTDEYITTNLITAWTENNVPVPDPTAVNTPGTYQLIASDGVACVDTASIVLIIQSKPVIGADKTELICFGDSIDLNTEYSTPGLSSSWTRGGAAIPDFPKAANPGQYRLIAADIFGCTDTAFVTLQLNASPMLGLDRAEQFCSGYSLDLNAAFNLAGFTNTWTIGGATVADPANVNIPGTYKLVSVTPDGCTDSVEVAITFNASLNLGADKNVSLCPGGSVDITKQFYTGSLTTTWTLGGVAVSNPKAVSVPGVYQLMADNGAGCTDIALVNVTFAAKPNLGADKQVYICQGKSINLAAEFTLSGLYTSWKKSGVIIPVPVAVSAADNYTLIATNSSGCSDTVAVDVLVNTNPNIGADKVKIICPYNTVDLTGEYNTAGLSVLWTLGGSTISNPAAASKAGNYKLVVTDANGCNDTAIVAVITGARPALGEDKAGGICPLGGKRNISAIFPSVYFTNSWTLNGNPVANPVVVKDIGYYQFVAGNSNGCTDTAIVNVYYYVQPYIGPDKIVNTCPGSSVGLNAQYNITGLTPYWTISGVPVSNPNAVTNSGAYQVIVTAPYGCSDTAVVNVSVKTKPSLGIDKKVTACVGSSFDLTALYNTVGLTSNWVLNSIPVISPSTVFNTGTYQLIAINASSCSDTAFVTLTHNPKPSIAADQFISICQGTTTDITTLINTTGLTPAWTFAGLPVPDPTAVSAAGDYELVAANNFSCTDTAIVNVFVKSITYSTTYDTICSNEVPYLWNSNSYSLAGSHNVILTNAAGCDSVATLELTIKATTTSITAITICSNELPFAWNGNSYSSAGTYNVTLVNAAGCDSLATLELTVNATSSSTTDINICEDLLPYTWNGNTYADGGTYNVVLTNAVNCDSTATLNLFVNKKTMSTTQVTICDNQLPYIWNGSSYSAGGIYNVVLTNAANCDSTAYLELTVNATSVSTTPVTICNNQLPYQWNGNSYSSTGTYNVTLTNAANCDSIATLELTVNATSTSTTPVTICSNQLPYQWNGNSYSSAGTYNVTLTNAANCDSIATLELTVNSTSTSTTPVTICSNQLPYQWNGNSYSSAGSYNVVLTNALNCDSIATLELTVNATSASTTQFTICNNQLPYQWNGNSYSLAGTYSVTLTNALNCDSVATLELTVNVTSASTTPVTICNNQLPYLWNGNSYSSAGTYSVTLVNAANCDSVATLVLSVNQTSASTTPVTICNNQLPYLWNGNSYSSAGSYNVVLANAANCDSVATLVLTVNSTTGSTTNTSVCEATLPYQWNGHSYSSAGTYRVTLINAANCDSVATLVLTVNKATASATNVNLCGRKFPYQWNNNSYAIPGTYTVTLKNQFGCDSVATLTLTEKQTDTSTTNFSICRAQLPYQWNGNSYSSAGQYTVNLLTASGCDSVAILILTVNEASSSITNVSICSGYLPYRWNGLSLTAAGAYKFTLKNQYGCDSVANLNLEVNLSTSSSASKTICNNELPFTWRGVEYPFAGTYSETFVNAVGCDSVASFTLIVKQIPAKPALGEDAVICRNDKFILSPGNYGNYLWQDNSTGPVFDVQNTGMYSVKVWEDSNCVNTDSIYVQVLENCGELFYPNAFTPNGDGLNDAFGGGPKEYILLVKNYSLEVFNRYGAIVFSTTDPYKKWDGTYLGKEMDPGTYAWVSSYIYKGKLRRIQKGFVVLLR